MLTDLNEIRALTPFDENDPRGDIFPDLFEDKDGNIKIPLWRSNELGGTRCDLPDPCPICEGEIGTSLNGQKGNRCWECKKEESKRNEISSAKRKRKYKMNKRDALREWADENQLRKLERERLNRQIENGEDYHLDHIVPIGGETIQGAHVPQNIRVLEGRENSSKGNKILSEVIDCINEVVKRTGADHNPKNWNKDEWDTFKNLWPSFEKESFLQ